MNYYFLHTKMVKTKKTTSVGKDAEELECKMAQSLQKTVWQFLKILRIELILFNILLENDLAILQIHIYEINTYVHLKTNALKSISHYCQEVETTKIYLSTDEWIN